MNINARGIEKLARFAASPYWGHAHYDDILQEARIGVWRAARDFDPDRGIQFRTYAISRAQGRAKQYVRRRTQLIGIPSWVDIRRADLPRAVACLDTCEAVAAPVPVDSEELAEAGTMLRSLPPLHRRAFVWYHYCGASQAEIADRLGVSQVTVSLWLRQDLNRLRRMAAAI